MAWTPSVTGEYHDAVLRFLLATMSKKFCVFVWLSIQCNG